MEKLKGDKGAKPIERQSAQSFLTDRKGEAQPFQREPSPREPSRSLLKLQRTAGNQAVGRLLRFGRAQAKLKVNQPDVQYEREADRVADAVMRMPAPRVPLPQISPIRLTSAGRDEEMVQRDVEEQTEERENSLPIAKVSSQPSENPSTLPDSLGGVGSYGRPLPKAARSFFEARFGHDFSQVRVYTDAKAAASARAVNALAYTVGRNVVFGAGQYQPTSTTGQRLLAHELTHVVQQTRRPRAGRNAHSNSPPAITMTTDSPRLARQDAGSSAASATVTPGDRFRISVTMADGSAVVSDMELEVDAQGAVYFSPFDATVRIVGLSLVEAEAALTAELSRRARVSLRLSLTALRLGGRDVATSAAGSAQTRSAAERQRRYEQFVAYLATTTDPPAAVIRYHHWLQEHRDSPELFEIEPWDLWSQSLRPPQPTPDPRAEREALYLRFIQDHNRRIQSLEGAEQRRELEAMRRFLDWYERNRETDAIMTTGPGQVYGRFSANVQIEEITAESQRQVEAERQARENSPQVWRQRGAKFDEFLTVAQQLWGYSARSFPYRIPIPSEGRVILVTGDPALQAVLDDLARDLMDWAGSRITDPSFTDATTTPQGVLLDLLNAGYDARIAEATSHPLQSESIDRREIMPGTALAAFGETVATGLAVIGIVGVAVGLEIITAGQATWLLVGVAGYSGVNSYLERREEIENSNYDVPIPATVVHSAGDVVGVSQLIEGVSGERLGTERQLGSVERSEQLGAGTGGVALALGGSRAYRQGQRIGQRYLLRQRGQTPPGPEGASPDPLPEVEFPAQPRRNPNPGPVEAAAREALPEDTRIGFDIWMEQIRGGDRPGNPEVILERMQDNNPGQIRRIAEQAAQRYQARLAAAQRAQGIRARAFDDPLRPRLRHVEPADNIILRYENRPPAAEEIAQAQQVARHTNEPVELFGDTARGVDYPGIDGTIGAPRRPLSLKQSRGAENVGYVRVHAHDALVAAQNQGYTHVEVHIHMYDSTMIQVRAAWNGTPAAPRGTGPVFDNSGTIGRIIIHASDGVWVLEPPLPGPALPGVMVEDRDQSQQGEQ